jgi:hypothetical protein
VKEYGVRKRESTLENYFEMLPCLVRPPRLFFEDSLQIQKVIELELLGSFPSYFTQNAQRLFVLALDSELPDLIQTAFDTEAASANYQLQHDNSLKADQAVRVSPRDRSGTTSGGKEWSPGRARGRRSRRRLALSPCRNRHVRNRAVLAQIQIPLKRLDRKVVLLDSLKKEIVIMNPLAAPDDLAIALRRQDIHAQRPGRD